MNGVLFTLFPCARVEIFKLLFAESDPEIHLREIVRQSHLSLGAIQKEMKNLVEVSLVLPRRDGNRVYFRANRDHPLYAEIRGLIEKTAEAAV